MTEKTNENLAVETKQAILECMMNGLISKIETILEEDRKILDDYASKIPSERIRCEKNKLENLKAELNLKYEHYEWLTKQDAPYWFKSLTAERIEELKKEITKREKKVNFLKGGKKKTEQNDTITPQDIERAKAVPLDTFLEVNRSGFAHCPLGHTDKTPSFKIYKNQNRWHCFGACGEGGDTVDLYMKLNDCDFITAVKKLVSK